MASLSSSSPLRRLRMMNLSLIGPPGSGKGSYGKRLATALGMPLVSVSSVLKNANVNVGTGKLVDDDVVSHLLNEHLSKNNVHMKDGCILDGYPRTLAQLKGPVKVHAAIHLNVPREVCRPKLLGRRACLTCGGNWNVAHVQHGPYHLPPSLPQNCANCTNGGEKNWTTRDDDVEAIVNDRLDTFYTMTEPILHHYEAKGKLFRFSPFRGYDDLPRFESALKEWLGRVGTMDMATTVVT